jgi:hypothetical protein
MRTGPVRISLTPQGEFRVRLSDQPSTTTCPLSDSGVPPLVAPPLAIPRNHQHISLDLQTVKQITRDSDGLAEISIYYSSEKAVLPGQQLTFPTHIRRG